MFCCRAQEPSEFRIIVGTTKREISGAIHRVDFFVAHEDYDTVLLYFFIFSTII